MSNDVDFGKAFGEKAEEIMWSQCFESIWTGNQYRGSHVNFELMLQEKQVDLEPLVLELIWEKSC